VVQVKAKYTKVPVQYDVRRSQQKQSAKQRNQPGTNHTKKHQTDKPDKKQATPTRQTKTTKEGEPQTPTRTTDSKAGRQDQTKRGRGRKKASGDQQTRKERTPRKAARQEGECGTSQEGGRVPLYRCPTGILDHSRAHISVPERGAHEQHPEHSVEGKAPHRAEAFAAMKRRRQEPINHDTPCQRYDNRTVAGTTSGERNQQKTGGSRGAPFGEGTLSPLRRYLCRREDGGGGGGERGTEAPLRYLKGASKASKVS